MTFWQMLEKINFYEVVKYFFKKSIVTPTKYILVITELKFYSHLDVLHWQIILESFY